MPYEANPRLDGYALLAGAVIQQAIDDLRRGAPRQRANACAAIRSGALDFWLEMLAPNGRAYHTACTKLRELISAS